MTPFDIVLVPFPFSDLSAVKRRPCLVLSVIRPRGLRVHYVMAMMTSNRSALSFPHDVVLGDWDKSGLPRRTMVRLAKVVTLDSTLIKKRIGRISKRDASHIKSEFLRMFSVILS
jgi:mRNA interferase MazF